MCEEDNPILKQVFSGFFDTSVGQKTDPNSYKNIAKEINDDKPADEILFLTDSPEGMCKCLVFRKFLESRFRKHCKAFVFMEFQSKLFLVKAKF